MSDYLHPSRYTYPNWEQYLSSIREYIHHKLKNYPNFNGIDFTDVSAGGIQIRGYHKQIKGVTYPEFQSTIKYDFNNGMEAADEFVTSWIERDKPEYIRNYKEMLDQFAKWGTD